MLSVSGVCKRYPGNVLALDGVDLDILPGEVCGLLGPNGAGKTTLVSVAVGLVRPDAGRVTVDGVDVLAHPHHARRAIGLAPQELGVYPPLTVIENLEFFGELAELRGRDLRDAIDDVADWLALGELMTRPVRDLSGGEKRRLHTAAAILHRPPLLLLDEPTSGVDVRTRAGLLSAVAMLAKEHGCAICYTTHYLPEVEALDGSVAIIEGGRMIARGTVRELIRQHGEAVVELEFDGDPGRMEFGDSCAVMERVGTRVRIRSAQPGVDAARLLSEAEHSTARLESIDIIRPSLEAVFLSLTGRRYDAGGQDSAGNGARSEEVSDVPAP
jgi:ABC-2 type transport system ATP-binding protein